MSLFGRLTGITPPALPAGARAYVDGYGPLRDEFCVRAKRPAEGGLGVLVRGSFQTASGAEMYANWCNGEAPLNWNVNGVGMPA
jgi:hypothetical protein